MVGMSSEEMLLAFWLRDDCAIFKLSNSRQFTQILRIIFEGTCLSHSQVRSLKLLTSSTLNYS